MCLDRQRILQKQKIEGVEQETEGHDSRNEKNKHVLRECEKARLLSDKVESFISLRPRQWHSQEPISGLRPSTLVQVVVRRVACYWNSMGYNRFFAIYLVKLIKKVFILATSRLQWWL